MVSPSSTSSSSRVPWAALLALGAVLLGERVAFDQVGLWRAAESRLEELPVSVRRVETGVVADRLALHELARTPAGVARVVLFGNSRPQVGVVYDEDLPGMRTARITHARLTPVLARTFTSEALSVEVDAFVLVFSELETHRRVRIPARVSFGSADGLVDIALTLGPRRAWAKRTDLERLTVATLFETYRHRDVLDRVWLNDLKEFGHADLGRFPRLVERIRPPAEELPPVEGIERIKADIERFLGGPVSNDKLDLIYQIQPGPHVSRVERLTERTIEILREAGCEVLLVEAPLNPLAYPLYDRETTRGEFLAFARRMVSEHGAHFLSTDRTGPFRPRDFADLIHLRSGRRLGEAVRRELERILSD